MDNMYDHTGDWVRLSIEIGVIILLSAVWLQILDTDIAVLSETVLVSYRGYSKLAEPFIESCTSLMFCVALHSFLLFVVYLRRMTIPRSGYWSKHEEDAPVRAGPCSRTWFLPRTYRSEQTRKVLGSRNPNRWLPIPAQRDHKAESGKSELLITNGCWPLVVACCLVCLICFLFY